MGYFGKTLTPIFFTAIARQNILKPLYSESELKIVVETAKSLVGPDLSLELHGHYTVMHGSLMMTYISTNRSIRSSKGTAAAAGSSC